MPRGTYAANIHVTPKGLTLTAVAVALLGIGAFMIMREVTMGSCAPGFMVSEQPNQVRLEGGRTASHDTYREGPILTVKLPSGYTYEMEPFMGDTTDPDIPSSVIRVVILGGISGNAREASISFHPNTGEEVWRYIRGEGWTRVGEQRTGNPLHDVLDTISASACLKEP